MIGMEPSLVRGHRLAKKGGNVELAKALVKQANSTCLFSYLSRDLPTDSSIPDYDQYTELRVS